MSDKAKKVTWHDELENFRQSGNWSHTQLSPEQEQKFRADIMASPWFGQIRNFVELGSDVDVTDDQIFSDVAGPNADYDLRGAWLSGLKAEPYPHDPNGIHHWPSSTPDGRILKAPTHPTLWMEFFARHHGGQDPAELGLRTEEDAIQWSMDNMRY